MVEPRIRSVRGHPARGIMGAPDYPAPEGARRMAAARGMQASRFEQEAFPTLTKDIRVCIGYG